MNMRIARWLIIGAGLAAYANSFSGPFIFDDIDAIRDNVTIRQLWPLWAPLATPSDTTVTGRPVVNFSFALNYAFGGLNVWGYHAVNLLIHLLVALTLFGVLRRMFETGRFGAASAATGLALAVSLLWVVHPLQTQCVTYLVHRAESLMGLCYLLALYCVMRDSEARPGSWWKGAAVLSCALGMGSKEVMVTAPPAVLLYDRLFLAGSWSVLWQRRRTFYLALAMTWGLLALLVLTNLPHAAGMLHPGFLSPWVYARTQFGIILHYLRLVLWPHPLVFYYDWPIATSAVAIWLPAIIIGGLAVLALWALRRSPGVGFLGVWGFLLLAPTSSVLPIVTELAAERRMYLPLATVLALGVLGADRILRAVCRSRVRLRRDLSVGMLTLLVAVLAASTIRRNEDYRSERPMWEDMLAKRPKNVVAYRSLGTLSAVEGKFHEAIAYYRAALQLDPRSVRAHIDLGAALGHVGLPAEAAAQFAEAIRLGPASAEAYNNLGVALAAQGKLDKAIDAYTHALRLRPRAARVLFNLGEAERRQGRLAEAKRRYAEAARADPEFAQAYERLGEVCAQQGAVREAVHYFRVALAVNPHVDDAQQQLAAVLTQQRSPTGQQAVGTSRSE